MGRHPALVARIIGCTLLAAPALGAAESLSLAHVLDVVRARNPAIAGAQARADAAAAIPARMAAYDDPVFTWEAWNVPESVAIDRADNNILRVSQRIPFPGKRTLAGEMAAREADGMRTRRRRRDARRRHARQARLRRPLARPPHARRHAARARRERAHGPLGRATLRHQPRRRRPTSCARRSRCRMRRARCAPPSWRSTRRGSCCGP